METDEQKVIVEPPEPSSSLRAQTEIELTIVNLGEG